MCCIFGGPKLKRKCRRYEIPSNDVFIGNFATIAFWKWKEMKKVPTCCLIVEDWPKHLVDQVQYPNYPN